MNYLLHLSRPILHSPKLISLVRHNLHCWCYSTHTLDFVTGAFANQHHPIRFTDRRLASTGDGNSRYRRTDSYWSGGFGNAFLPVAASLAILVGVLTLRWYVNLEPNLKSIMSEARENVGTLSKTSLAGDKSAELVSVARRDMSGDSSSSPAFPETDTHSFRTTESSDQLNDKVVNVKGSPTEVIRDQDSSERLTCVDPSKACFPTHVRYLIIGAGTAGLAAARAIRASDPTSRVLMVGGGEPPVNETDGREPPPYLRPSLSKELWRRSGAREAKILQMDGDMRRHSWFYYEPDSFFLEPEYLNTAEFGGVALLRGDSVVSLDPDVHKIQLKSGRQVSFDRCLLATGGRPKQLPDDLKHCSRTGTNLVDSGHISYFRNLSDYKRLRKLRDKLYQTGGRIAVLGGGFLGSELTVSLLTSPGKPTATAEVGSADQQSVAVKDKKNDKVITDESTASGLSVVHIFQESAPMGHILPPCLALATARFESSRGADLRCSAELVGISIVPDTIQEHSPLKKPVEWSDRNPLNALHAVAASESVREKSPSDPQQSEKRRIRLRLRRNDDIHSPTAVEEVEVDHLVCAIGLEANTELADSAGLEVDEVNGGFLVNAELESRAGVYVAGDAASYWDPVLSCRRRVEHLNFAEETGTLAGKNMAVSATAALPQESASPPTPQFSRYHYQSSLWSSLGEEVNWDAVGLVNSRKLLTRSFLSRHDSPTPVSDSEQDSMYRGVVFYLTPKERRLVGILLWNLPDFIYTDKEYAAPSRLNVARGILTERRLVGQSLSSENNQSPLSEEEELSQLASKFDLYGVLEEDYAQLKAFIETKQKEIKDSVDNDNVDGLKQPDTDAT